MSKINIYETGWLNMVFEGRNKAYGAYQLRTENPKTTIKALFSALFLLGGAAAIPVVISYFEPKEIVQLIPEKPLDDELHVTDVIIPEEEIKIEETTPSKPLTDERMIKYVNMVVADNTNVTEDVATNDQLDNAQIGQVNIEGPATNTNTMATTPPANPGGGTSSDAIETTATLEMQPQYPGGIGAFLSTVGKNFKTPEVDEGVTTLKVLVSFVIEKDGTLSHIRVTRDPGYNLGKEATRVLNSMKTKWSPGYKNGQPVRTAYNLPITVNVN